MLLEAFGFGLIAQSSLSWPDWSLLDHRPTRVIASWPGSARAP